MMQHPQVQARALLVEVPRPNGSAQRQVGFPVQFSRTRPVYRHIGPPVGAHTWEVLKEGGFTSDEVKSLAAHGVFGADLSDLSVN